ncbi:LamG domain-containing protein [Salinibacterium sp.]|uniref:LamG domain-containing protein n=1 Tax=Salinibacterium sp. TaxID=1915057 RepID=UPI00286C341C|nr:LamG domain-containing protein [Salinibacterium sp.]
MIAARAAICRPGSAARLVAIAAMVALLPPIVVAGPASAYWSVDTSATSVGAASAATVNSGSTPTATVANRNQVTVNWTATTLSNGVAVTGYAVTRYNSANVAQSTLAGCAGTITATTCIENGVPDGLWTYRITPLLQNWVGVQGTASTQVRTDTTAPVNNISVSTPSNARVVKNGDTVWVRTNDAAGSFTLSNALTDAGGSGAASSNTGGLGGTTTGWSHTPSSVSTPVGGPFVSNAFSWTSNATGAPVVGVAGVDNYGNTASATIAIKPDNTAPTGGAISYLNGTTTSKTQSISLAAISDAESGAVAGSRILQRSIAQLTGSTCGVFGSYIDHITSPATLPTAQTVATPAGFCYRYQYVFTDSVGNLTTTVPSNAAIVTVRSYSTTVAATGGILNYYRMADTNTTIADSMPAANNGTYVNAPLGGQAGAPGTDTNTSVLFDGVDDYGTINRQIQNDFSIEFWFKSTQGRGNSTNWYDGAGLVDAEVGGISNDFGISLMANGRVAAGTGNPDSTILSAAGFNNNAWHHVVFTRTAASASLVLYIDGAQVATGTGGTQPLNASAKISFGHIQTSAAAGTSHYAGNLDEIAIYNAPLTLATVQDHYQVGILP